MTGCKLLSMRQIGILICCFLLTGCASEAIERLGTLTSAVTINVPGDYPTIQEAVDAKRFHHQWLPDQIRVEQGGLGVGVGVEGALTTMGHTVRVVGTQGSVHAIMIDPETGERVGAPDLRDPDSGAVGIER